MHRYKSTQFKINNHNKTIIMQIKPTTTKLPSSKYVTLQPEMSRTDTRSPIQNATIFDLQVKNIDFRFSSKLDASGIFLVENITFNGQM